MSKTQHPTQAPSAAAMQAMCAKVADDYAQLRNEDNVLVHQRLCILAADQIASAIRALKPADATPADAVQMAVPADVAALVVAAREALYGSSATMQELENAVEAFASRVCWDDDGGELPEAHADPCTCRLSTPLALDEGDS